MKRTTLFGFVTVAMSVCVALLGMELILRLVRGQLLYPSSAAGTPPGTSGRMAYHSRLGWIPAPGRFGSNWISNADATGVRSNGRSISAPRRPVLAVGDSFTFGEEVDDGATWAAQLEAVLTERVINAGVSAYGIDQAFLRAELLLEQFDPSVVILAFISSDIDRTEHSFYPFGRGCRPNRECLKWKPFFEYGGDSLVLRNVPVPRGPGPPGARKFPGLRRALSYSILADALIDRIAPGWWRDLPAAEQIHDRGEDVSVALLVRLKELTGLRQSRFLAVALATNGRIGDNDGLPSLVNRAREKGVEVLDLSSGMLALPRGEPDTLFQPGGHYAPAMNLWIAERIAASLNAKGDPIRPVSR